jgi:hypothetical protein
MPPPFPTGAGYSYIYIISYHYNNKKFCCSLHLVILIVSLYLYFVCSPQNWAQFYPPSKFQNTERNFLILPGDTHLFESWWVNGYHCFCNIHSVDSKMNYTSLFWSKRNCHCFRAVYEGIRSSEISE